jgi:hypothetical protein
MRARKTQRSFFIAKHYRLLWLSGGEFFVWAQSAPETEAKMGTYHDLVLIFDVLDAHIAHLGLFVLVDPVTEHFEHEGVLSRHIVFFSR